jgi:hypothetical protein
MQACELDLRGQLADGNLSARRCVPPYQSIVFDPGSLFPNGPSHQLRVASETLVGFRVQGTEPQMSAAAGLVNGSSVRREAWPRRALAISVETKHPIAFDGVLLASFRESSIAERAIWSGPSILRWGQDGIGMASHRTSAIRLISDGYEAETLPPEAVDADMVLRCRLAAHARWVRVTSPALLPHGHGGSALEQRRFGIAVVELGVDGAPIRLNEAGLLSGFYPIEGEAPRQWRWTNGSGLIALAPSPTKRIFHVRYTNWHNMLVA